MKYREEPENYYCGIAGLGGGDFRNVSAVGSLGPLGTSDFAAEPKVDAAAIT